MMDKEREVLQKFLVHEDISIREAMLRMDHNGEKALFVVNKTSVLLGALTDGDVRRCILKNSNLDIKIKSIYNKQPIFAKEDFEFERVRELMLRTKIEWIPVVNNKHQVVKILVWDEIFDEHNLVLKKQLKVPVVIMAGGEGTRLEPFTKVFPKPLMPLKGRPIIELVMERFKEHGIKSFFVTLNYKSLIIRAYFQEANTEYKIRFITEHRPLGTAGSLKFFAGKIRGPFFVTNCDTIINCDYSEIINFHLKSHNDITIVGSFRNVTIPYGICEINNQGRLLRLKEKPSYDFLINTGMYVLDSNILKHIPPGQVFHMTDLIKKVRQRKGKISVFPTSENSWIDIGQWEEYRKVIKLFQNV